MDSMKILNVMHVKLNCYKIDKDEIFKKIDKRGSKKAGQLIELEFI